MIVRRFREHAAGLNWFAVGIDLIVAIVGVFIGIQAANWNQGRLNRAEGTEYRQRLIVDLTGNIAGFADRRGYYGTVRAHAVAALAQLTGKTPRDAAALLIHAFEASQMLPRRLGRFTYDEISARGATTWIGDAKLRELIANYYVGIDSTAGIFASVAPYRELVRTNMPDDAQQAVRRDCPETISFAADGAGWARLSGPCTLTLPPAVAARDTTAVRAIPGLVPALNRLIADLDGKLLLIGPPAAHARDLRGQIAAAADAG